VSPLNLYSGDRHKLHLFLTKCRHNFLSCPELFPNESQKVLFASGYLDGAAFNWFQLLLNQYSEATVGDSEVPPEFETFAQVAKPLEETFRDPDLMRSKERELGNFHQTTSVASYLADFNRIKDFIKWNDKALGSQFYKGLKSGVKDGLVYKNPATTTLTQLLSSALRIDSRQFERLLERKLESSTLSQSTRGARYPSTSPFS
jgi:Retrotransposon gag protein